MVRKRFREQILHDVAHDLVPRVVGDALRDKNVQPMDTPKVRDLQLEEGQPLTFSAAVEVAPHVDPGDLSALSVQRPEMPVSEDDVDQALSRLRDRLARMEPVEERLAETGDTVVMNLSRRRLTGPQGADLETEETPESHQGVSAEIGAAANPPGFDEGLLGVTAGTQKTFEVTFPSDYEVEEMAGAPVESSVTVKGRKGAAGARRRVREGPRAWSRWRPCASACVRPREDAERDRQARAAGRPAAAARHPGDGRGAGGAGGARARPAASRTSSAGWSSRASTR